MVKWDKHYKLCKGFDRGSKIYVRSEFEDLCHKLTHIRVSDDNLCIKVYAKLPSTAKIYLLVKSFSSFSLPKFGNPIAIVIDMDVANSIENLVCKALEISLDERDWKVVVKNNLPLVLALPILEPNRVVRFLLVGAMGSIVNLAVAQSIFNVLTRIGLTEFVRNPLSSASGFESSVLFNFILHEKWTFRDSGIRKDLRSILLRLIKYHGASITSFSSQLLLATILPITIGLRFWVAQLIGIVVGFALNFILGYVYTWSGRSV
ncbi:MAG: GtrA family protein [Thermosphaera sp.]